MYQLEQKLQNMQQSSFLYQFLKKLVQIAISFSVFSILFSHPSWPPLFHSFISHFSTFSSQLFALATDKNYIFLLCNGILVFIAKYSSHTVDTCPPCLPETSPHDDDLIYKAYSQGMQPSIEKSVMVEDVVATNEDGNESRTEMNGVMQEEDVEEKHVLYQVTNGTVKEVEEEGDVIVDNEVYMKENFDCWSYEEQRDDNEAEHEAEQEEIEEDEQEQEAAIAQMSTEELNRKFDEFIRRMKEDLRIEAQQQLIMV